MHKVRQTLTALAFTLLAACQTNDTPIGLQNVGDHLHHMGNFDDWSVACNDATRSCFVYGGQDDGAETLFNEILISEYTDDSETEALKFYIKYPIGYSSSPSLSLTAANGTKLEFSLEHQHCLSSEACRLIVPINQTVWESMTATGTVALTFLNRENEEVTSIYQSRLFTRAWQTAQEYQQERYGTTGH